MAIDIPRPRPALGSRGGGIAEIRVTFKNAGVGAIEVDWADISLDPIHHVPDGIGPGHVASDADPADPCRDLGGAVPVQVGGDDFGGAFGMEALA